MATTVQITTYYDFRTYAFGGKSIITIVSNKTQRHYTYKFTAVKGEAGAFIVEVMIGHKYYAFGKILRFGKGFKYIPKYVSKQDINYKAFMWTWRHIVNNVFPKKVYVWREDKCCVCGKRLTFPESIVKGIGPECIKTYKGIMPGGK